jgi:hypothetical protein
VTIRFLCEGCGVRIKVPDGSEGGKLKCPKCETTQTVPTDPSLHVAPRQKSLNEPVEDAGEGADAASADAASASAGDGREGEDKGSPEELLSETTSNAVGQQDGRTKDTAERPARPDSQEAGAASGDGASDSDEDDTADGEVSDGGPSDALAALAAAQQEAPPDSAEGEEEGGPDSGEQAPGAEASQPASPTPMESDESEEDLPEGEALPEGEPLGEGAEEDDAAEEGEEGAAAPGLSQPQGLSEPQEGEGASTGDSASGSDEVAPSTADLGAPEASPEPASDEAPHPLNTDEAPSPSEGGTSSEVELPSDVRTDSHKETTDLDMESLVQQPANVGAAVPATDEAEQETQRSVAAAGAAAENHRRRPPAMRFAAGLGWLLRLATLGGLGLTGGAAYFLPQQGYGPRVVAGVAVGAFLVSLACLGAGEALLGLRRLARRAQDA